MPTVEVKLKTPHFNQQKILNGAKRFNTVKCGRRFGKTILTEELSIQPALDGFPIGYWTPTYKDVSKVWDEIKFILQPVTKRKDEQVKQIHLITGGSIDFWSLDEPNNGRGFAYKRAIIDECEKARHFQYAWEKVIRATLADMKGDAWFLSTPKFGQSYFKTICKNYQKFDDWSNWVFSSYDNPYIDKSEIDAARTQLDELTFNCEYLAEDVDIVGKPFAYAFSESKHVGSCEFNGDKEVLLSFDFNVSPSTAVAAQLYEDRIEFITEFTIDNSNTYEMCDQIHATFPHAVFLVTGDATGRNRSALAQGNINHYDIIKQKLGLVDTQIQSPTVNPHVEDRRVLMNSILQNFKVVFDKDNCPLTIRDMKYVEYEDGKIQKDRSSDIKKSDHMDATGYLFSTFMGNFIKINHAEFEENYLPSPR